MNFFESLLNGVKGVLQGRIMRVATIRTKNGDRVKIQVGIPDLMINFETLVPERFVPDCAEGKEVHFVPGIRLGEWGRPTLDLQIKNIQ
jgi:hypothetical protein